jgi:ribosomal protein L37E
MTSTFGDFWREWLASPEYVPHFRLRAAPPLVPGQQPQAHTEPSCRKCGSTSFATKPGPFGPHAAKQACAGCGRFVRWLSRAHLAEDA